MKLDGISKEVSAGKYRVEVKKEVYYEQSRTVNIEKGKDLILPATSKHFEDGSGVEGDMVFLQGGTYQMGSNNSDSDERPVHTAFSLSIFRLE